MRLCSRLPGFLFLAAVLAIPVAAQQAPTPPKPSASAPPPGALPVERQPDLTVDHDPVPVPDTPAPAAAAAAPQSSAPQASQKPGTFQRGDNGSFTLRRDVEEVVLNATVLDQNGHLVNTLTKDDFKVFEDNVPQTIAAFQHSDLPVSMGILVDNSGSMHDKRGAVNSAALDLVKASNPQDEAFIVNFSDEAFIDQDFTSNVEKLREGLAHIDSKGGTALYDAVIASADELSKGARHPKQVLLIITDGEDNASSLTLEQTIRRIQDLQGPVVYSIGLLFGSDSSRESHRAQRALQLLSDETGGLAFFPKNLGQVDAIADEVARDIRSQYTIGYHSTKPASLGGYRAVRLDAKAPHMGKLIVRTRSGYYPKANGSKTGQGTVKLENGQQ